jgi:single-strand DNA-binding protein
MAFVRVEQRNARLAAAVRIDTVRGKDGPVSKGTAVAISNVKRQGGDEEATSIQWTFWGKQAESAAEYLGRGSRVNIVGRVQNNNYENADKVMVYGLTFTCEEIDYLDSRMEGEARRTKQDGGEAPVPAAESHAHQAKANGRARKPAKAAKAVDADDIPF